MTLPSSNYPLETRLENQEEAKKDTENEVQQFYKKESLGHNVCLWIPRLLCRTHVDRMVQDSGDILSIAHILNCLKKGLILANLGFLKHQTTIGLIYIFEDLIPFPLPPFYQQANSV